MQGSPPLLHCIASGRVSPFSQKVQLFRHAFAGVVVVAITHDSSSLSLSQIHSHSASIGNSSKKSGGSFFTIGEIKAPNINGEAMNLMKVRVPKNRVVSSLAFVPSGDGRSLYVLVQCVASNASLSLADSLVMNKTYTYLYMRMEEVAEKKDGLLGEDVVNREVVVSYKRFSRELELVMTENENSAQLPHAVSYPWSSSTWLPGWKQDTQGKGPSSSLSSPMVAASTPPGKPTALHVLQVSGVRTRVAYTVNVEALSQFPISCMLPIPGFGSKFIGVCHNSILELDLEKAEMESTSTMRSSNALVTRAWRCASEVPLMSFTVRDHLLLAGSATGTVLLWELRGDRSGGLPKAAAQIRDSVAPITGIYACDASTFFTCSLDGKFICWQDDSIDAYGSDPCLHSTGTSPTSHFPFGPTEIPIPELSEEKELFSSFFGQSRESWVSMAGERNIIAVLGEYGSLFLFIRS